MWPSAPLMLEAANPHAERSMITFSGLGSIAGRQQSGDMAPLFPHLPPAHWEYSTDGFSIDALAQKLRSSMPRLQQAGLNGHSMGGPSGLETIRRAGVPELGPVVLHGSPFDIKDARSGRAAKIVNYARVPIGPGAKTLFSFVRAKLEGQPTGQALAQARTDAVTGCSPRLWVAQMRALQQFDLTRSRRQYADMTGSQTEVWYCMPEDPEQDLTIDTVQASQRYGEFFTDMEVPFHIVRVPEVGHADVTRNCAQLAMHEAILAHAELAA
jgi:hypothetical protein